MNGSRTVGILPSSRMTRLLAILCLFAFIALAVATLSASSEDGDLYLEQVAYDRRDSDGDGLMDSVMVTAKVVNGNDTGSMVFTLAAILKSGPTQVSLQTTGDRLDPLASTTMTLNVSMKVDTPTGYYTLLVELHEQHLNGPLKDSDETTVELYPLGEYDLELTSNQSSAEGIENTTVLFTLHVQSLSNNPTDVDLVVSPNLGWTYQLETEMISLEPSQEVDVGLEVLIPHNTPPATIETLSIEAIAVRNASAFSALSLKVMVSMQEFDVGLDLTVDQVFVASGDSISVQGFVTNRGNNQDNITITTSAPPGWTVVFNPSSILLDRSTTAGFEMVITVPANLSKAGSNDLNVTAFSTDRVDSDTRKVTVVYNTAELRVDAGNVTLDPQNPEAGQEVTFQVRVANLGVVTVKDLDVVLRTDEGEVARTSLGTIAPGGIGVATLEWMASPGTHLVRIVVDPDGEIAELDETNNMVSLTISVTSADLEVLPTDITIEPSYPVEGSDAQLSVVVRNTMGIPAPPFKIVVSVDDEVLETHEVTTGLVGGENETISVTWMALAGRHSFKVEVDPEGKVMEEDRSNNMASRSFSINQMPQADLQVSDTEVKTGEQVAIDASGSSDPDGRVRQYLFDYGDGSDSGWTFLAKINHSYIEAGKYELRLYVRDEAGAQNAEPEVIIITVTAPEEDDDSTPGPVALMALLSLGALTVPLAARRRRGKG